MLGAKNKSKSLSTDHSALRPPRRSFLDSLLLLALFYTALVAAHASLLRLPYFWDEAGYYVPADLTAWSAVFMQHLHPGGEDAAAS